MAGAMLNALRRSPNLPDRARGGLYLGNGSNVYLDTGRHLELATPEVTSPRDAVVWEKAGERLLELAAEECGVDGEFGVPKNNVDYTGHTWGCHENYLVSRRLSFERVAKELIPFLVTRQIYAGAGKISPRSQGMGFELSQRSGFIVVPESRETTGGRGIVNTRDETLSSERYRRIHLILGDSLMSELGTFLKVGTTALLLRLMDVGVRFGDGVEIADPVEALHAISRDPFCREKVRVEDGRLLSAEEVQRHYLRRAMESLGKRGVPAWVELVVTRWSTVLDQLAEDPLSLSSCLDSYIKLDLYTKILQQWGSSWLEVKRTALEVRSNPDRLHIVLRIFGEEHPGEPEDLVALLGELESTPAPSPLAQRLMALDIAYHNIRRSASLFYSLEQKGLLEHRMVSEEEIASAMVHPPQDTRAGVRGKAIRELCGVENATATWYAVWVANKVLDLRDPIEGGEKGGGHRGGITVRGRGGGSNAQEGTIGWGEEKMTSIAPTLLTYLLQKGARIQLVDSETLVLGPVPVDSSLFNKGQSNLLLRHIAPWDRYIVCVDADLEMLSNGPLLHGARLSHPANGWKAVLFDEFARDPNEPLIGVLRLLGAPDLPTAGTLVANSQADGDAGGLKERLMDHFALPLSDFARGGELPPTVGRERELDQILAVVHKWDKPMVPVVLGEPGSGKTNLLFELSRKLESLPRKMQLLVLDAPKLTTEYNLPGEAERGFCKILQEVRAEPSCFLAIERIDILISVCTTKEVVLHRLGDCRLPAVATALPSFLRTLNSEELRRRYFPVFLEELSQGATRSVLAAVRPLLERHHALQIPDGMMDLCLRLSLQRSGVLPGKSVELLDLACAELAQKGGQILTADDLVAAAERPDVPRQIGPLDGWEAEG